MGGLLVFLFLLGASCKHRSLRAEEPPEALFVGDDMILEMEKSPETPPICFWQTTKDLPG